MEYRRKTHDFLIEVLSCELLSIKITALLAEPQDIASIRMLCHSTKHTHLAVYGHLKCTPNNLLLLSTKNILLHDVRVIPDMDIYLGYNIHVNEPSFLLPNLNKLTVSGNDLQASAQAMLNSEHHQIYASWSADNFVKEMYDMLFIHCWLRNLINVCSNLQELNINSIHFTGFSLNSALDIGNTTSLTTLKLTESKCRGRFDNILPKLPNSLRELSLSGSQDIRYDTFERFINLVKIDISYDSYIFNFKRIATIPFLKELRAIKCGIKSLDGIECMTNLEHLDLNLSQILWSSELDKIATEGHQLNYCKKLKNIKLVEFDIEDKLIPTLDINFLELESLETLWLSSDAVFNEYKNMATKQLKRWVITETITLQTESTDISSMYVMQFNPCSSTHNC